MLHNILQNYASNIKGIINIGTNIGQEVHIFKHFTNNIVLVEPVPQLHEFLQKRFPDCIIVPYALGSISETKPIYLASNNYESSSLLKPKDHTKCYPSITFTDGPEILVKTFNEIKQEFNLNLTNFNVIIADTQGFDLEVLKGFGSDLENFNLVICEYIDVEYYENNSSLDEIKSYMSIWGFEFKGVFDFDSRSGNAIFLKNL